MPAAVVVAVVLFSTAASAHVTVHPNRLPKGAHDVILTFVVPNERDDARTVAVQVFFPVRAPLLGVLVSPVAGWTSHVVFEVLRVPVQTDDGAVRSVVAQITWRATGSGVEPGQFLSLPIDVGSLPDTGGQVVFKALQTYSSGEIVRWIQVPDSLNPAPETPAPILTMTSSSVTAAPAPSSSTALAVAALACAVLALAGVIVLFVRRRPS